MARLANTLRKLARRPSLSVGVLVLALVAAALWLLVRLRNRRALRIRYAKDAKDKAKGSDGAAKPPKDAAKPPKDAAKPPKDAAKPPKLADLKLKKTLDPANGAIIKDMCARGITWGEIVSQKSWVTKYDYTSSGGTVKNMYYDKYCKGGNAQRDKNKGKADKENPACKNGSCPNKALRVMYPCANKAAKADPSDPAAKCCKVDGGCKPIADSARLNAGADYGKCPHNDSRCPDDALKGTYPCLNKAGTACCQYAAGTKLAKNDKGTGKCKPMKLSGAGGGAGGGGGDIGGGGGSGSGGNDNSNPVPAPACLTSSNRSGGGCAFSNVPADATNTTSGKTIDIVSGSECPYGECEIESIMNSYKCKPRNDTKGVACCNYFKTNKSLKGCKIGRDKPWFNQPCPNGACQIVSLNAKYRCAAKDAKPNTCCNYQANGWDDCKTEDSPGTSGTGGAPLCLNAGAICDVNRTCCNDLTCQFQPRATFGTCQQK